MGSTVPGSGSRVVDDIVDTAGVAENDVGVGAGGRSEPPPRVPPRPREEDAQQQKARVSRWAVLVVLALVLAVAAWATFRPHAAIALDVGSMPDESLALSGLVLYGGKPVKSGTIHLAVSSADTKYHLASVTLHVVAGNFSSLEKEAAFRDVTGTDELRIDARFWGIADESGTVVETNDTLWSNCSTPLTREDGSAALALFLLLSGFIIVLFTMELSQFWARVLFATSYLATFLSVTLPLVAIAYVSQNPYLTQVMEDSPFGLVRAHTPTVKETQWLLNVGGLVERDKPQAQAAVSTAAKPEPPPPPAAASADPQAAQQAATPAPSGTDSAPKPPANKASATLAVEEAPLIVRGGLAIPFYVIILAIFGAGINMMRRIPAIQAKHVSQLNTTPMVPSMRGANVEPMEAEAACNIRQAVIEQHMYLLAAPFLAIAVYYLLQVLANDIAQPVIVLMAFSAGLISERIVAAVIGVAGRTLGDTDSDEGEEDSAEDDPTSSKKGA